MAGNRGKNGATSYQSAACRTAGFSLIFTHKSALWRSGNALIDSTDARSVAE
jgi:hypothetical protein